MLNQKKPKQANITYNTCDEIHQGPSKQSYPNRSLRRDLNNLKRKRSDAHVSLELPFQARPLSKNDYEEYRHVFGLYLDIQKGKNLVDLDDIEAKGRWKSFLGKWNRGELLEGWYDPSIKLKANENASGSNYRIDDSVDNEQKNSGADVNDSDESIGPTLPGQEMRVMSRRPGPTIPLTQDLQLKREICVSDRLARRDELRFAQKVEKQEQKAALEELISSSAPGTKERQIEKKKELNEKMKQFREKSPGAADVPDTELIGDGDDLESYKKAKKEIERKKTEREIRKEENLRARIAERQERLREYKAKEEGTMAMLKALAKQRFG